MVVFIEHSNVFVESLFPLMQVKWTGAGNSSSKLIKIELRFLKFDMQEILSVQKKDSKHWTDAKNV